jgi:CDP-paratose 2-epimerase
MITGSAGLIGCEAAAFFCQLGFTVVGIENDMRRLFFGEEASTGWKRESLVRDYSNYFH